MLPAAYLKNGWSWLDFITTLTSYTPYLPGNATDVSSLRAFRALRPLRTLSAHPGIRLLVSTLISAIPVQAAGQMSPFGPITTVAVPAPMSDLSVHVCSLLGRCHPLDPSTLQQCQPPCLSCLCMCAVYWAGVSLWTHQHCSSASPHVLSVCACVQATGQVSPFKLLNTTAVPAEEEEDCSHSPHA